MARDEKVKTIGPIVCSSLNYIYFRAKCGGLKSRRALSIFRLKVFTTARINISRGLKRLKRSDIVIISNPVIRSARHETLLLLLLLLFVYRAHSYNGVITRHVTNAWDLFELRCRKNHSLDRSHGRACRGKIDNFLPRRFPVAYALSNEKIISYGERIFCVTHISASVSGRCDERF